MASYATLPSAVGSWAGNLYTTGLPGTWTVLASVEGVTSTAALTVTNRPPVAGDDATTVDEDSTNNPVEVLVNDSDPDPGDRLSLVSVGDAANGSITNRATDVSYTPAPDFCGTDAFTYTVCDLKGASDVASVTITVSCLNDPPVAVDDAVTVDEDSSNNAIDVLGNDSDVDQGDVLTRASVGDAVNGAVTNSTSELSYTPAPDFCGTDSFTYTVSDAGAARDTARVSITVRCLNDRPVAVDDEVATTQGQAIQISVTANDFDPDPDGAIDRATVTTTRAPDHGIVSIGATGIVTYTPEDDHVGVDTFLYVVQDDRGATSNEATVSVDIAAPAPAINWIYLPLVGRSMTALIRCRWLEAERAETQLGSR